MLDRGGEQVGALDSNTRHGWESVEITDVLDPWVSRMRDLGFDVAAMDVMSVLVASGEVDTVLRVVADVRQDTATDREALRQFVPHTRVFFHRPKAVDLGWDAVTAGAVFAMTGSGSLASGLTILRRAIQTFRRLTPDEMDVVLVMRGLCGTRDRHRTTISLQDMTGVYEGSPVSTSRLVSLLESLQRKGVVLEVDGGWRLVP